MTTLAYSGSATGTGSVTLVTPATNSVQTLTLPDNTGTLVSTATSGVPIGGPAFSAFASTSQTVSSATFTKVIFGSEDYDTNNNFASSTFTPAVAGGFWTAVSEL